MKNGKLSIINYQFSIVIFLLIGLLTGFSSAGKVPVVQTAVISAEGQIEPQNFADLAFQTGGVVASIMVAEGESVQAGDVLIQLDTVDLIIGLQQANARLASANAALATVQNQLALAQAGVQTAQAGVAAAEANLALTLAGPLPAEIAQAENNLAAAEAAIVQAAGSRDAALSGITTSQIRAAEATLASATADLRMQDENYQAILDACFDTPDGEVCPFYGPVEEGARAQLEVAQLRQSAAAAALDGLIAGPTSAQRFAANGVVGVAEANRDMAQAQLELLLADTRPELIAIAEIQVQQTEIGVSLAEVAIAEAEAAVTQAEAGVATAQAAVNAANAALARMTLRAPFDGVVTKVDAAMGELVAGAMPLIVLADVSTWLVKTTDLTELDVAQVDVETAVSVRVDAIPDKIVQGMVTNIALTPSISRGDVVYEVTIQLEDAPNLPLRWGMTVFADIDS